MKYLSPVVILALTLSLVSCKDQSKTTSGSAKTEAPKTASKTTEPTPAAFTPTTPPADAATIMARKQVPVLCYHHIHDFTGREKPVTKDYIVPPANFAEQMKSLADSGYQTILPEDYNRYLLYGAPLPKKPVMITFDDTDEEQYTIGSTEMNKYGFKGVFFIMTISIGKPRYMTKDQIKELSDKGNVIACHTWDHHSVKKYTEADWEVQLTKPKALLENITGKPVDYFAYPFGLWNEAAIPYLKQHGFKAAYQLSDKRDASEPLYTLRRMLVPGTLSTAGMFKWMNSGFK